MDIQTHARALKLREEIDAVNSLMGHVLKSPRRTNSDSFSPSLNEKIYELDSAWNQAKIEILRDHLDYLEIQFNRL